MRLGRLLRKEGERAMASQLKACAAIGLRKEFAPVWTLPLPKPMPSNADKHVLLLDIDETLIHTFGMTSHVTEEGGKLVESPDLYEYHYLTRPYLREFLEEVNQLFEVIFWTSGTASYCAAILDSIEQHILELPPSFYSHQELMKAKAGAESTSHANFYALSRTQTLEAVNYMKYIPMIGRKATSSVLIDDNVRSFPLTPRAGIKISPFYGDDTVIQRYLFAVQKMKEQGKTTPDAELMKMIHAGSEEIARMEGDTGLLEIMPLLRRIAGVPRDGDVRRELDHWRCAEYVKCDDFKETMNQRSVLRNTVLGTVLPQRNDAPIAAFRSGVYNSSYVAAVDAELQLMQKRPPVRSNL